MSSAIEYTQNMEPYNSNDNIKKKSHKKLERNPAKTANIKNPGFCDGGDIVMLTLVG